MKTLLTFLALTFTLSPQLLAAPLPPANDHFTNRIVIPMPNLAAPIVFTNQSVGRNTDASREPGEPEHAFNTGGKSVWWSWTAPTDGDVRLITDQSTFDTLLAVYTGSVVASLTTVAANDDHGEGRTSRVRFRARAGITYQIAVDGYANPGTEADSGNLKLSLTFLGEPLARPPNDHFTNATAVIDQFVAVVGSNLNATHETGEPDHAGESGETSVWWAWTAPASGSVTVSTEGSTFDTLLGVYAGNALGSLALVAANDDIDTDGGILTSRASFTATAGTTYRIAVDGYDGASGAVALRVSVAAPVLGAPERLGDGTFRFALTGSTGRTFEIQATTNLTDWTPIGTVFNAGGTVPFVDALTPGAGQRFYRALLLPVAPGGESP
jgi:hypothetical protein